MYKADTIAAISTAVGLGGIGIIRISGELSFEIAGKLFKGKTDFDCINTHTVTYGHIIDPENEEIIDEVLMLKMKGPKTFTREDTVEINCHGSGIIQKKILSLAIREGARLAEPGEFTKMAFLNGRLDLSQAEAVIDLIHSKTDESAKAALNQLEGKLSLRLKEAGHRLVELIAHIEVTVDYPEHDIEEITGEKVYDEINVIILKLQKIIEGFERGRIIREGLNIAIVGRPNVGKSSLLNELAGKSKAIVTDIPGTTRDIVEEYINIQGIPVKIIDTAGIRETEDVVERIGVEKARDVIESADLILFLVDTSIGLTHDDLHILENIRSKRYMIILNKIDLVEESDVQKIRNHFGDSCVIKTSLTEEIGIDVLEKMITEQFQKGEIGLNQEILVTNIRHKDLIDKAIISLKEAKLAHERGLPLDCLTIDIKNSVEFLAQITGESVSEEVLHEIFSKFCIGK